MRTAIIAITLLFAASTPVFAQLALPAAFDKPVPESVQDLQAIERHVQRIVDKVLPATVGLRIGNAAGSGVIINRQGHILTAGHVSGQADREAVIILHDGRRLRGKTLGANNGIDSGMVVITEQADFPIAEMAKSSEVQRGQWCLSLGHPGGFKTGRPPVVRLGRVQGLNDKLILSDCTLVGGDSGGPLFDMHGRVIGIHSRIGDNINANIHVPIDTYRDTWNRLTAGQVWGDSKTILNDAKPAQPYLGLRAGPDNATLKIESITPGSPAEKAGLRINDVIVKIDNRTFASVDDLGAFLRSKRPGTHLSVQVQRGNEKIGLTVVLGKR